MGHETPNGNTAMDTTEKVEKRYDRNSRFYELYESPMERLMFGGLRRRFFEKINADTPKTIIEIGVGTGKNLPYYRGQHLTGIDISDRMLKSARLKNQKLKKGADLRVADAQALPFADGSFDAALATFVFCSVPDPVKGLREVKRVVKNGGKIYLMEHVRPTRPRSSMSSSTCSIPSSPGLTRVTNQRHGCQH